MLQKIIKTMFLKDIVFSSIKVAFVVGIILNLINQYDLLMTQHFQQINKIKFSLTFLVPYLVSTYASVRIEIKNKLPKNTID